jgi:hypothetical protein
MCARCKRTGQVHWGWRGCLRYKRETVYIVRQTCEYAIAVVAGSSSDALDQAQAVELSRWDAEWNDFIVTLKDKKARG